MEILLARRFSLTDAIGWLVDRQVVPHSERRSAYYSIAQRLRRTARASGRTGSAHHAPEPRPADD